MNHPNKGSIIEEKGWRQGGILQEEDTDKLLEPCDDQRGDDDIGIVISQSCDLIHDDFIAEPYAEIIIGTIVQEENGHFTAAKNPRLLHLRLSHQDGSEQAIELTPIRRYRVERSQLIDIVPDQTRYLQKQQIQYLARWLAGRYERAALPTAFNDRVKAAGNKAEKKRQKIHRRLSPYISGLYIKILPFKELQPHEQYHVQLLALIPADFEGDFESINKDVQDLENLLTQENINVTSRAAQENKITVATLRRFERFPLEYLSLREEPPHPLPADL